MINHTVLFKLKPEASQAQIDGLVAALQALSDKVPTLQQIQVGHNFSDRSKGFSVMLYSTFLDKEGLAAYAVHPEHVKVVNEHVKPILEDIVVADIEY